MFWNSSSSLSKISLWIRRCPVTDCSVSDFQQWRCQMSSCDSVAVVRGGRHWRGGCAVWFLSGFLDVCGFRAAEQPAVSLRAVSAQGSVCNRIFCSLLMFWVPPACTVIALQSQMCRPQLACCFEDAADTSLSTPLSFRRNWSTSMHRATSRCRC